MNLSTSSREELILGIFIRRKKLILTMILTINCYCVAILVLSMTIPKTMERKKETNGKKDKGLEKRSGEVGDYVFNICQTHCLEQKSLSEKSYVESVHVNIQENVFASFIPLCLFFASFIPQNHICI